MVDNPHEDSELGDQKKYMGNRTNVELAFIRASRHKGLSSGVKSSLSRAEFLDFIVRLSCAIHQNVKQCQPARSKAASTRGN